MKNANVRRAFLFGAGASHSYSQSPTRVKPPLAGNFFQAFNGLSISADRYVRIGSIINYVRDTRGLDPIEFGDWEENIEDFLTEIDERIGTKEAAKKLAFGDLIEFSQAYDQMIFLFASVLNEIQNGPVCNNYAFLCACLRSGDVLITFNWDTLLDRALHATGKWSVDDGYRINFKSIFRDGWSVARDGKSQYPLIKLHGSTNWLMPYFTLNYHKRERVFSNPTIDLSTRPMYCFEHASVRYETYGNRSRIGYEPFSYFYYPPNIPVRTDSQAPKGYKRISMVLTPDVPEYGRVREGVDPQVSMPLIIPPVRHKQYGLVGDAFDHLWNNAQAGIMNCAELIIVGYSFPVTDVRAWAMLEAGVEARSDGLKILLIDPFPDPLATRLLQTFGTKISLEVLRTTFEEFCRSHLDRII